MADIDRCGCGIRANKVFLDNGGTVYSCTGCMREIYETLSEGGKKPVFMDDLLDPNRDSKGNLIGPIEVKPIADPAWKGFPKANRKYSLTG